MRAVVWQGTGDIRLDTVPDPKIEEPTDAVIRVTRSAICGTDLHLVRGTMHARIPYAMTTLVGIPDSVSDDQAILLSDIFPTSWFGARLAEVGTGDTVLVLGTGIVGQLAILSAKRLGASRVLAVDGIESRLAAARAQHAEPIDFHREDPVAAVRELTGGIGVDRVIDAVGVDAQRPAGGPAAEEADQQAEEFDRERRQAAPQANPQGSQWVPGDAPSQAARWAVQAVAKAGPIGVIGVYPPGFPHFPLGDAMNKNLTIKLGNCNHRRYLPRLMDLVASGTVDLTRFITQRAEPESAIEAYQNFDRRAEGWLKTVIAVA